MSAVPLTAAVTADISDEEQDTRLAGRAELQAAGCLLYCPTVPRPAQGIGSDPDMGCGEQQGWLQCTLNFQGLLNKQMQKWISRAWPLLPGFQAAVGEGLLVPSFLRAIRSAVPFLKRPPQ